MSGLVRRLSDLMDGADPFVDDPSLVALGDQAEATAECEGDETAAAIAVACSELRRATLAKRLTGVVPVDQLTRTADALDHVALVKRRYLGL